MAETNLIMDLVKEVGFSAIVFAIWMVYHRNQAKQWVEVFRQSDENWKKMLEQMDKKSDQTFQLLRENMQTIQAHTMILARIENKVEFFSNMCERKPISTNRIKSDE
jgi:hypothetical protein